MRAEGRAAQQECVEGSARKQRTKRAQARTRAAGQPFSVQCAVAPPPLPTPIIGPVLLPDSKHNKG
jgi:hypothetical protein